MADLGAVRLSGLGAALPPGGWIELLARGTVRRHRAGAVLLRQGSPGSYVLALTEGWVIVTRVEANGEELALAIRHPGEILGDITALDQASRSATVTALTPCTVYAASSEQFRALIERHAAADAVARHAFARLREAEQVRFELKTLPVAQRLACALLRLRASGVADHIGLSQEQVAKLIGASRNAVVTALAELRAQGVISTSRRRLIIADPDALRQLAARGPAHPGDALAV